MQKELSVILLLLTVFCSSVRGEQRTMFINDGATVRSYGFNNRFLSFESYDAQNQRALLRIDNARYRVIGIGESWSLDKIKISLDSLIVNDRVIDSCRIVVQLDVLNLAIADSLHFELPPVPLQYHDPATCIRETYWIKCDSISGDRAYLRYFELPKNTDIAYADSGDTIIIRNDTVQRIKTHFIVKGCTLGINDTVSIAVKQHRFTVDSTNAAISRCDTGRIRFSGYRQVNSCQFSILGGTSGITEMRLVADTAIYKLSRIVAGVNDSIFDLDGKAIVRMVWVFNGTRKDCVGFELIRNTPVPVAGQYASRLRVASAAKKAFYTLTGRRLDHKSPLPSGMIIVERTDGLRPPVPRIVFKNCR